ncbi:MAG: polymer-forming cytoskeletal protein [candidate division NC10 bacterium]|jgi:cytoskeletal protein CcmA (bactofilin family)|nr:polymer-forming cytoskeletal protein [candidate division NC10 bacterium]MCH7896054.1 polymer-forming cytoskeletal protein [candidate division NC10 bacterium]MCZ6550685.1 polymer-forming cytoskeletal protein [candidate division NC10 bacterium]
MLWNSRRKPSDQHSGVTAFFDEGSKIEGKYTFTGTGTLLLNGEFRGEIVTTDAVIVGEKAVVNATIRAATVVIIGEVLGNVQASGRVELKGTARVFGDLEAPVVVIEEGVLFRGQCRMATTAADEVTQDPAVVALDR